MRILRWAEEVGRSECPYLRRWVLDFWLFSIRLHHWLASDDHRNFHDHPWWYLTFVLKGGYTDVSEAGEKRVERFTFHRFPASHKHTVRIDKGSCWTLVFTGRETRDWGFWVNGKFRKRNKYFFEWGHHQCGNKNDDSPTVS
jgi:hypothetical protein